MQGGPAIWLYLLITGETDYVAELCDEADCYDNNESSQMSTDATEYDL